MKRRADASDWSVFEADVQAALEAMGYSVDRDVFLNNSQVDLLAVRQRDFFTDKLIVECKQWSVPVGVAAVRQLQAVVESINKRGGGPCAGLMVSSSGLTRAAKGLADEVGIAAYTLSELAAFSFDPSAVIATTIKSYVKSDLLRGYVDLSCKVQEFGAGTIYKPVEYFLDEFLETTKRPGAAVLGNFGTGKTSLCRHYAYLLAARWEQGDLRQFLPIYLNLRDVRSLMDLSSSILTVLEQQYNVRASTEGLRNWLRHRKTLLFLDGFDEMAARLDRPALEQNVRALENFAASYSCKIILTCRTHFFRSRLEERHLFSFLRLYMCDWGATELEDYVAKKAPRDAASHLRTIRSTYNLEDLSKTPIFLSMITDSIGEIGGTVNQAKLYQLYTDRWIQSQDYRSRIPPDEKRDFMEALALEMTISGKARISHSELPARVRRRFASNDWELVRKFDEEVRTCSFLVRDSEGEYYFVHRSYMEFFVAVLLARRFKEGITAELSQVEVTPEIGGFMASFFESDWEYLLRNLLGHAEAIVRSNCAVVVGQLLFRSEVRDTLILALKTEREETVARHIVRALLNHGDEVAIKSIAELSKSPGEFGAFCVEVLGPFVSLGIVAEIYSGILLGDRERRRLLAVIRSMERGGLASLRSAFIFFLKEKWWRGDEELESGILQVLTAVGDVEMGLTASHLVRDVGLSTELRTLARGAEERLRMQAQPQIETAARGLHAERISYRRTEGELRSRFGYLVDDIHLKTTLKGLYGDSDARKATRQGRRVGRAGQPSEQ